MHNVDTRRALQHFHRQLRCRTGSSRGVVQLAGLRFRQGDEFSQRSGLDPRIKHQQIGGRRHHCDRLEILERIIFEIGIRARRNHVRAGGAHGQGVTVRVGACGDLGAQRAAGTTTIVDDDLLTKTLAKLLPNDARDDVGGATRRKRHDQANWLARVRRCLRQRSASPQRTTCHHRHARHHLQCFTHHALLIGFLFAGQRAHLDQTVEARHFVHYKTLEFLRRTTLHFKSEFIETLFHIRQTEQTVRFAVQFIDDSRRRFGRCRHAEPDNRLGVNNATRLFAATPITRTRPPRICASADTVVVCMN